jgi:hypothetical protein
MKGRFLKHKRLKSYRNPVALAREWQESIGQGDCLSGAELARKLRISRARVTQTLRLLELTPEVSEAPSDLGDPLLRPVVTERKLRSIVNLPAEEQRWKTSMILLPGSYGQRS